MDKESVKVSIPPEQIEALKEKYSLSDDALNDVMKNLQVSIPRSESLPMPSAEDMESGEPKFMRQLMRGEISLGEAVFYGDYIDRKEERREKREKQNTPPLPPTAEEIGKHVGANITAVLRAEGLIGKSAATGGKEEMPEWAKEIENQQTDILNRLRGDEDAKKLRDAVDKELTPVRHELEKATEKIKELSKPTSTGLAPPKGVIQQYIDGRNELLKAGIIQDQKSSNIMMVGPDGKPIQGIPVKGEIPAAIVYGPAIVKQVLDSIEGTVDRIAAKYGLVEPTAGIAKKKELITLPPKPKPKAAEPPTIQPPTKPILTLPEKPKSKVEGTEEAKVHVEESAEAPETTPKVEEAPKKKPVTLQKVCAKCDSSVTEIETPRGIRYHCSGCKKFTKIKEIEKSGKNTTPANN